MITLLLLVMMMMMIIMMMMVTNLWNILGKQARITYTTRWRTKGRLNPGNHYYHAVQDLGYSRFLL